MRRARWPPVLRRAAPALPQVGGAGPRGHGERAQPRALQDLAQVGRALLVVPWRIRRQLHPRPARAGARLGRPAKPGLQPDLLRVPPKAPPLQPLRRGPGGLGAPRPLPHAALPPRRVPQRGQTRRGLRRDGRELLRPGGRAAAAHARRRARHLRLRPPGAALLPDRPRRGGADAGPQRAHPAHAAGGAAEPHALHPRGAVRRRQPDRKPRDAAVH
mmetsp:Transcript_17934/g.52303  ORF Transcript_17934/g.52303 Transcript_17934/m.52303 type:complete len:216 (+) Transcript_17934:6954-7601(+)